MLVVEGVSKRYGPVQALDNVGFAVAPGEIIGFLGPNGAGKTTAMRAIMQLVALDAGTVTWAGRPVDRDGCRRFGYMPAERGMYPRMRVRDHLVYYGQLSGLDAGAARRAADEWLDRLGLRDRGADEVQKLSSGNQQRVQLALALLSRPDLLVLDEPFSGLDPIAVDVLSEILREEVGRGAALLLSSHQLDLVGDVCSGVVIIDRGRVVLRGDVADLRAASARRYVTVDFTAPTDWPVPAAETIDRRRYTVAVTDEHDAESLIAAAHRHGRVVGYSFAPPDLSEVFVSAVEADR